jgi:two-component system cell cycle sensor histidine kinase/response regulator CckA
LLVEDDEGVRELTRDLLTRRGYRVLEAVDAVQAIAHEGTEAGPIHLLLTDVVLPGKSGVELATHLRALRPLMRVLYISGYTDEAFVKRGVLTAGVPFLHKPYSAAALTTKVRAVLDDGRAPAHDST